MIVSKRDGRTEQFSGNKIHDAVIKAGASKDIAKTVAKNIYIALRGKESITIDTIHEMVEVQLMRMCPESARRYIEYRSFRDRIREHKSDLHAAIKELVEQRGDVVKENANKNAQLLSTQRDLIAGIVSKHFAKFILPDDIIQAHIDGTIHYHDLDYSPFAPMTNCCLVDLRNMLTYGFAMGNAELESPKSITVACAVMAQITAQVASHQYGGTTFANVDLVLAPYVEKSYNKHLEIGKQFMKRATDEEIKEYAIARTEKEALDAFQGYEYEINTLFTTCGQSPFVTLTFGQGTKWSERLIQQAILKNRIRGIGSKGITPTFPKLVMFMEEGVNMRKGDINYDIKRLALECASKRMYPDIISVKNNKILTGSSKPVSPMGCRSFLSVWKDENGNEVLDGRNNLGVVSLNLPRIAIEANGSAEEFFNILEERLDLCHRALETRIKSLEGVKANVAPVLYMQGAFGKRLKADDDIIELFKGHRSSISLGYIGLYEVGELLGKGLSESEKDRIRLKALRVIRERVDEWKSQSEFGYSLYSTPAESLCYRFAKLDKERFGEIEDVTDKGYYTNSFHQDVRVKTDPFTKIDKEAPYHFIASGGHISYVEGPKLVHNLDALETIWDYAMERLDYFGFNTPCDLCYKCGCQKEMLCTDHGFVCPDCGNNDAGQMNVTRRTCGYLGGNAGFNFGKIQEIKRRIKHVNELSQD